MTTTKKNDRDLIEALKSVAKLYVPIGMAAKCALYLSGFASDPQTVWKFAKMVLTNSGRHELLVSAVATHELEKKLARPCKST